MFLAHRQWKLSCLLALPICKEKNIPIKMFYVNNNRKLFVAIGMLLFCGILHLGTCTGSRGHHQQPSQPKLCTEVRSYDKVVKVTELRPVHVRKYEYCMSLPSFRCSKIVTEIRKEEKNETITKTENVPTCCAGYRESSQDGLDCFPICTPECQEGKEVCVAPNECDCDDDYDFTGEINSINNATVICGESKLKAKVTKFHFTSSLKPLLRGGKLNKIELASPKSFVNNGTSPIETTYEGRKVLKDKFLFEKMESLSLMDSVVVDSSVGSGCGFKVPLIPDLNLTQALQYAYQFESRVEFQGRAEWALEQSEEFEVSETFTVAPCSMNEVSSFILVREDIPLEFEVNVEVTGVMQDQTNNGTTLLTAGRLRRRLPEGMGYLKYMDNFKILAKTQGRILVSLALTPEIATQLSPIPECQFI